MFKHVALTLLTLATPALVAQDLPRTFTLGVRARPVTIPLPKFAPRASEGTAAEVIHLGEIYAEEVRVKAVNPDHHLGEAPWPALVTMSAWLKLLAQTPPPDRQTRKNLQSLTIPEFLDHVFPDVLDGAVDADAVARAAVLPFRTNWLYGSHEASTLDDLEHFLAESLKDFHPPSADYTPERLHQFSLVELERVEKEFKSLANAGLNLATRPYGHHADVEIIKKLGRFQLVESRSLLLMIFRQELNRALHGTPMDYQVMATAAQTFGSFGGLDEPWRGRFDRLHLDLGAIKTSPAGLLETKMDFLRRKMLRRRGNLPVLKDLLTQAHAACVKSLQQSP